MSEASSRVSKVSGKYSLNAANKGIRQLKETIKHPTVMHKSGVINKDNLRKMNKS